LAVCCTTALSPPARSAAARDAGAASPRARAAAVSPSGGLLGSTASAGGSTSTNSLLKSAEAFFSTELAQMRKVESAAISAANMAASSQSLQVPLAHVPLSCSASSLNYLACAFTWSVAFTNEIRRLQVLSKGESGSGESRNGGRSETLVDKARLRVATPSDVSSIMGFIRELAIYEKEPEAVKTTESILLRDGFSPSRQFHCVLLELPSSLVYKIQAKGEEDDQRTTTAMETDSTILQQNEEQVESSTSTTSCGFWRSQQSEPHTTTLPIRNCKRM
jgi:hypothetical protein